VAQDVDVVIGTKPRRGETVRGSDTPRADRRRGAVEGRGAAALPEASEGEAKDLIEVYRASRKVRQLPDDNLDIIDAIGSDIRFRIGSVRWAENQRAAGGKAWLYLFTHASPGAPRRARLLPRAGDAVRVRHARCADAGQIRRQRPRR